MEENMTKNTDENVTPSMKTKPPKRPLGLIPRIIIIIAAVIFLVALAWLIYFFVDRARAKDIYEDANADYTKLADGKWYEMLDVDFTKLKSVNSDTKGWLFFENEDISYPIVQGTDDEKYLATAFDGSSAKAGSIFLEAINAGTFTDKNSILYGHNMANGTMFGKLQKYKNEDGYYKEHLYFQVITEDKIYRYQIFAYNDVPDTSDVYTVKYGSNKSYVDYIRKVKQLSQANIDVPNVADANASDDDKILQNYKQLVTLSTCTSADDQRFVVLGALVGEYNKTDKTVVFDSVGQ